MEIYYPVTSRYGFLLYQNTVMLIDIQSIYNLLLLLRFRRKPNLNSKGI